MLLAWLLSVNHGVRYHTMFFLADDVISRSLHAEAYLAVVLFNDPNDDVITNDQGLTSATAYDDHGIASMPNRKGLEYCREAAGRWPEKAQPLLLPDCLPPTIAPSCRAIGRKPAENQRFFGTNLVQGVATRPQRVYNIKGKRGRRKTP